MFFFYLAFILQSYFVEMCWSGLRSSRFAHFLLAHLDLTQLRDWYDKRLAVDPFASKISQNRYFLILRCRLYNIGEICSDVKLLRQHSCIVPVCKLVCPILAGGNSRHLLDHIYASLITYSRMRLPRHCKTFTMIRMVSLTFWLGLLSQATFYFGHAIVSLQQIL